MPCSQIVYWRRIKTSKAIIRRAPCVFDNTENKVCGLPLKPTSDFNWSKNNLSEIHISDISQGPNWALTSPSHIYRVSQKFVPIVNCIWSKAFNNSLGKCKLIQVRNSSK